MQPEYSRPHQTMGSKEAILILMSNHSVNINVQSQWCLANHLPYRTLVPLKSLLRHSKEYSEVSHRY